MKTESFEDQVSRLRQMCEPGQQNWDLSPKDTAAISMAVRVLSVMMRYGIRSEDIAKSLRELIEQNERDAEIVFLKRCLKRLTDMGFPVVKIMALEVMQ